ncbi:MAG: DNA-3-methyladenine glycosylase I, partial [Rhodanobacter sp.]
MTKTTEPSRCHWAANGDPLMRDYHDTEWGVPLHDDRALFEFLCLEGAQAGLSWRTVLAKRDNYRKAFHQFEIARVAAMTDRELGKLLLDPGIIRNRLKVSSTRDNAIAALDVIAEFGSLDVYLWSFVDGKPLRN